MRFTLLLVIAFILSNATIGFAEVGHSKVDPFGAPKGTLEVTVAADGVAVADVLTSLASQSKQRILVESSVKGMVKEGIKEKSLESALSTLCKANKLAWRKVYIDPKSELLEKPDRFAAVLRLMSGMSFPDVVVAGSSTNKVGLLCQQKQGVEGAQDKIVQDLALEPVYLVSNDATVAARQGTSAAVNSYNKMAKDQMDLFMKMTPEEREEAMMASLDMMNNVGPEYMASVMQSLMNTNPETLRRLQARQTDVLFQMPVETRRAMIKMNMDAMKNITPEQQKLLREDAMAVMEEMKKDAPTPQQ